MYGFQPFKNDYRPKRKYTKRSRKALKDMTKEEYLNYYSPARKKQLIGFLKLNGFPEWKAKIIIERKIKKNEPA